MIISRLLDTAGNNDGLLKPQAWQTDESSPEIKLELKTPTHRLALEHWHAIRGMNLLPARSNLDLGLLAPILSQVVLLDVSYDPLDFIYRIIGDKVRTNFTENFTGRSLSDIPGKGPGSNVFENLTSIVEKRAPRIQGVPYVGPNKDFIRIESLALPLASDHEKVDKIMIVVEFVCVS